MFPLRPIWIIVEDVGQTVSILSSMAEEILGETETAAIVMRSVIIPDILGRILAVKDPAPQ